MPKRKININNRQNLDTSKDASILKSAASSYTSEEDFDLDRINIKNKFTSPKLPKKKRNSMNSQSLVKPDDSYIEYMKGSEGKSAINFIQSYWRDWFRISSRVQKWRKDNKRVYNTRFSENGKEYILLIYIVFEEKMRVELYGLSEFYKPLIYDLEEDEF